MENVEDKKENDELLKMEGNFFVLSCIKLKIKKKFRTIQSLKY